MKTNIILYMYVYNDLQSLKPILLQGALCESLKVRFLKWQRSWFSGSKERQKHFEIMFWSYRAGDPVIIIIIIITIENYSKITQTYVRVCCKKQLFSRNSIPAVYI